ncbi:hypothetical protein DFH28DRAFT_1144018 [Melampsora americana]|nr:hypothetical protein DFH28DRAFT_1144018 [Melampsora americana]
MSSKITSSSSNTNKTDNNDIPENAKSDQKSDEKKTDPRLCRSRSRLDEFLLPSTKSKDLLSEAENGRPLRNRRVLTLILLERFHGKLPQRTSNRFVVSSTDTQTQTSPKDLKKTPSIWLVASRWIFLPKSKLEVKDRLYKCPKDIKKKLEEDIANINKEMIKDLTDYELFEFYEYLNKLNTRKIKSSKISK